MARIMDISVYFIPTSGRWTRISHKRKLRESEGSIDSTNKWKGEHVPHYDVILVVIVINTTTCTSIFVPALFVGTEVAMAALA